MRQYIGARYMPKFMGEHSLTTEYEVLSVVDNGQGTSYISNKPTPAGTPLTNGDYWTVYGASSGAVLDLQNRMQTVEGDIADFADVVNTKRVRAENEVDSTSVPVEVINFAGQGQTGAANQRGLVIHQYNDGECLRIDNVGEAPAVSLVNAHNAVKRADKPANYHGRGDYMRLMVQADPDGDEKFQQEFIGLIDNNGDIWRSGYNNILEQTRNHTFGFVTNKLYGYTYAFRFEATNDHGYFMLFKAGGKNFGLICKTGNHGIRFEGSETNEVETIIGGTPCNITISSTGMQINFASGKTFKVNLGGTLFNPSFDDRFCQSNSRPTKDLYNGITYKETDTHRIIQYFNGAWYNAMGQQV